MAVTFCRLLHCASRHTFPSKLSRNFCRRVAFEYSSCKEVVSKKMPPKRKPEAQKVASAELEGASGEQPESKKLRGKQAKQQEIPTEEAKPRRGRGRAVKQAAEDVVTGDEEPAKATKTRGGKKPVKNGDLAEKEPKSTRTTKSKKNDEEQEEGEEKPAKSSKAKLNKESKAKKGDEETKVNRARGNKDTEESTSTESTFLNPTETSHDKIDYTCSKKSALGGEYNFKISSWNVDGLRSWIKKKGLEYIQYEQPDILCLQEIKCSKQKIPDKMRKVDGYQVYWESGEKEGYSGVALLSKKEPISVQEGLGIEEFDKEGRCITAEFDNFYVISVYVPNAGRKLVTLPKRLEWNDAFKAFVKELDNKKPVIICGDMNVAHNEIDIANPKTNTKNAGFTVEERKGMTEFLGDGYVDTFRHLYPDETGAYTFWSYMSKSRSRNIGWRLDYFIVSEPLMKSVCDNVIRHEVFGSDHCPITLFINV